MRKRVRPEECLSCLIEAGRIDVAKFVVLKTDLFIVNQDFDVPIPGFLIISSRRHLFSPDEFTVEEAEEFGKLVRLVRLGMRRIAGVNSVCLFQNEEGGGHFHLWLFPQLEWMERFGGNIESVRPIINWAKANLTGNDEAVNRLIGDMREFLNSPESLSQL